jgi:hypothetical protein
MYNGGYRRQENALPVLCVQLFGQLFNALPVRLNGRLIHSIMEVHQARQTDDRLEINRN